MLRVGQGTRLDKVIADKDVEIGNDVRITPENRFDRKERIERFEAIGLEEAIDFDIYGNGLVVLAKGVTIPEGFIA